MGWDAARTPTAVEAWCMCGQLRAAVLSCTTASSLRGGVRAHSQPEDKLTRRVSRRVQPQVGGTDRRCPGTWAHRVMQKQVPHDSALVGKCETSLHPPSLRKTIPLEMFPSCNYFLGAVGEADSPRFVKLCAHFSVKRLKPLPVSFRL